MKTKNFEKHVMNQILGKVYRRNSQLTVQIHITDRCNFNCKHCYLGNENAKADIELSKIAQIINNGTDHSFKYGTPVTFILIGGDPLLHPNILEIGELMFGAGMPFFIKGNPFKKRQKKPLEDLKAFGLQGYQISVDGFQEFHDDLRGDGSFVQAVQCLRMLNKLGLYSTARITVFKENLNDIKKLIPFLTKLKVSRIGMARSCDIGNYTKNEFFHISPEEYRSFLTDIFEIYKKYYQKGTFFEFKDHLWVPLLHEKGLIPDELVNEQNHGHLCSCSMFQKSVVINSNMQVIGCPKLPDSVIKIDWSNDPLDKLLFLKQEKDFMNDNKYEKCKNCRYKYLCMGCPATALGSTGSLFGKDPQCWL